MNLRCCFLIASCLLVSGLTAAAPTGKLMPIDEASKDPSFFLFRARLFRAIAERDAAAIFQVLDPKILNSFGGDGGIDEFKKAWKAEAKDSELWSTLSAVLAMGGKFESAGEFEAPYVCAAWPDLDPFDYGAITAEGVRVRNKPDKSGDVVASLSFDIVRVLDWNKGTPQAGWVQIRLADGRQGYVASDYISSAAGWRAHFTKKNGIWKMTSFIAGD